MLQKMHHLWGSPSTQNQHKKILWMFMLASMKAAIHMGPDCTEILEVYKNTNFEELQNLFDIHQKLVPYKQAEILNVKTIDCASPSRTRWSLAHDQAIKWFKAKVRVYSDSVFCLGKVTDLQMQIENGKVKWDNFNKLILTKNYLELMDNRFRSSGIFSHDLRHWISSEKSIKHLQEQNIEPGNCEARVIFMSISNSEHVTNYGKKFAKGHWTFFGPGSEKKFYGKSNHFPEGSWHDTANMMVEQFEASGHPVFKGVSPLARGILRKKNNEETIHFSADASNTALSDRTSHSAHQLNIYGAVARWCEDFGMTSDETPLRTIKWSDIERSSTKRIDFFGKRSKECAARTRKQCAWSSTQLRNTGNRCPIYKKSWRSSIHPWSCCRTILQNSLRCGWWFWRSNSSMQWVYESSGRLWFQNLCCDWTKEQLLGIEIQIPSTISAKKISWVVLCRGQNSYVEELPHLEPGPNPTCKELLREKGRELLQRKPNLLLQRWTNPASRKLMRCRNLFLRAPCALWKRHFCGTKEVDWHSCQQNLKIGHEIGTSLWSRCKRS